MEGEEEEEKIGEAEHKKSLITFQTKISSSFFWLSMSLQTLIYLFL